MYRVEVGRSINNRVGAVGVILFSVLILGLCSIPGDLAGQDSADVQRFEDCFPAMGVRFRVVMYAPKPEHFQRVCRQVRERINRIEESLSDYDSESEINRLVRSAPHESPVVISDDFREVCRATTRIHRLSGGAFDPTIGPVSMIWRLARKRNRLPDEQQIRNAMRNVGWHHLHLTDDHRIRIDAKSVRLDFGGIAKGYAADQAIDVCRRNQITRALIDAGGDLRVSDPPPGRAAWRIGVDNFPASAPNGPKQTGLSISAKNRGVATSGDARQHLVKQRQVYSHILDPRTGQAIRDGCAVTVIALDATTADALASAFSVLGSPQGLHIAETTPGVEALFVCPDGHGGVKRQWTTGFQLHVDGSITNPAAGLGDGLIDQEDH